MRHYPDRKFNIRLLERDAPPRGGVAPGFLRSSGDHLHIPAAALLLSIWLPATALAHAELVSATPAANSMATPPPTELRFKFSEGIEIKFTKVKVTGPDNKAIETSAPKLDPSDNTVLIVPLSAPLPDGKYTVDWQAVSADGHKTMGSYGFESMR
jgi:methionine-rich copper-binding protein CopC